MFSMSQEARNTVSTQKRKRKKKKNKSAEKGGHMTLKANYFFNFFFLQSFLLTINENIQKAIPFFSSLASPLSSIPCLPICSVWTHQTYHTYSFSTLTWATKVIKWEGIIKISFSISVNTSLWYSLSTMVKFRIAPLGKLPTSQWLCQWPDIST